MIDTDLRRRLAERIEEGEFGPADLGDYLTLFCQVCNVSPDAADEVKGWDRKVVIAPDGMEPFCLRIEGGRFAVSPGMPEKPDLILRAEASAAAAIFSGEKDATSAYVGGVLKIEGALPDAVKVRSLIEIAREEIDGEAVNKAG